MTIRIRTTDPTGLLNAIKLAIRNGQIETWSYDSDDDFTHTAKQWNLQAWLRPSISTEALVLSIFTPPGVTLTKEVYGIYHGRFIEMVLVHFDDKFEEAIASSI